MTAKHVALVIALLVPSGPARADNGGFLHQLAAEVSARLDTMRAAHMPKLVPPVPVVVHWRPQKLGSLDLGAPLVALTAVDLDGDGRAEIYAVTSREVVAIGFSDKRLKELGRVAFTGELAVPAPRDVVGAAITDGRVVIASVSSYVRGIRVALRANTLVADPGEPGFELCLGEHVQLAPGRNYFGDATNSSYGTRCRSDLVAADGHPLKLRAQLSTAGKAEIAVERCSAGGADCKRSAEYSYSHVGVAFELVDLDRDGRPEIVFAGAHAYGDPDELRVVTLGEDEKKTKLRKSFTAGGVAGIAVTDLDGNGTPEVIAAVRLVGATRVDLWRMN